MDRENKEKRKERREAKKAKKKCWSDVSALIPVESYDTGLECFRMTDKSCMDLFRIACHDFASTSADDLEYINLKMEKFYKKTSCDCKLICINIPENCTEQKRFLTYKMENCRNSYKKNELMIKYRELEWLEKNRQQKEYYFMVFAENADVMKDVKGIVEQNLTVYRLAYTMERMEKITVLTKMMNQQQRLFAKSVPEATVGTVRHYGYDPYLLSAIQPAGGIRFETAYVRSGSSYLSVLTIYDFKSELQAHWLSALANLDGITTTVDIATESEEKVRINLNRSFREQRIRQSTERNDGDYLDARRRYQELLELRRDVTELGDVAKLLTVRVFVAASSLFELEKRVSEVQAAVEAAEYHCTVFLNEQKFEWQSLLLPYKKQQMLMNRRYGQLITSHALADGNPFNFSYLSDPKSVYMGSTPRGGSFKFSIFHKTPKRLSYNALVYGTMGSGKSTLLKKLIDVSWLLGDYVRVFDPSGEYEKLAAERGGKYLNLDGSEGIINEFDIQKVDELESSCWVQHVSKMSAVYRIRRGNECTQNEINTYCKVLLDFYIYKGILPADGKIGENVRITGLPASRYPTMSDFLDYLNLRILEYQPSKDAERAELGKRFLVQLDNIRVTYENLVRNYGYLLNGHTTIGQIAGEPFIVFNIRTVLKLDDTVCNGIIYNALMIFWDHCVQLGLPMKNLFETGRIAEEDVVHSLVIFDESHHILNERYSECIRQMTVMAREMRKYFAGIVFATQLVTDNLKGDTSNPNEKLIQDLFELAVYKFVGKQNSSCIPILRERFPGVFTEAELFRIPRLGMGEFIASMEDANMEVKIFINEEERLMFAGGR